jgi:hypothetical protein
LIFPVWKFTFFFSSRSRRECGIVSVVTIGVGAFGISYVEDEYIAVNRGTISWIDPTTGKQIRELKTGSDTKVE